MNSTEKQYDDLELSYKQPPYGQQQITVTGANDANVALQDWTGHERFFVSFEHSTEGEQYNREIDVDGTWAKIAQLSRERWSKENPY